MLNLTGAARERVLDLVRQLGADAPALRISVCQGGSPLAPEYDITLVEAEDALPGNVTVEQPGFPVLVEPGAAERLQGAALDFQDGAFRIREAAAAATGGGPLAERVRDLIERRVNPAVAAHGGRITLVEVRDDVAYVRMSGGCQGCGMAAVTLRQGVERMIRDAIPEIRGVADVTDHATGATPFFAPAK